jgi:hypothetical protein
MNLLFFPITRNYRLALNTSAQLWFVVVVGGGGGN